jgi:hypothetical protein
VGHPGTAECQLPLSCLIPRPLSASTPRDTYDQTVTLSIAQYAARYYNSAITSYETENLINAGATGIVHRSWLAPDGDDADVAVLNFTSPVDAEADALGYQGSIIPEGQEFAVPGVPGAIGVVTSTESNGMQYVALSGYSGRYEVRMGYWSPSTFRPTDALTWFDQQMAAF